MLIRHPDSARGYDLYETPEVATLALLRPERLPRTSPKYRRAEQLARRYVESKEVAPRNAGEFDV